MRTKNFKKLHISVSGITARSKANKSICFRNEDWSFFISCNRECRFKHLLFLSVIYLNVLMNDNRSMDHYYEVICRADVSKKLKKKCGILI